MFRHASIHATALALVAVICSFAPPCIAADVKTFLNAPAWKLEYQVNFKGACEYPAETLHGPVQCTASMEGGFSTELLLDLRSGGAGAITMTKVLTTADGSQLSAAEQQQRMMDLIMRTDSLANWMTGGAMASAETEEASQAAVTASIEAGNCTGYLNYSGVSIGPSLHDETGSEYSLIAHRRINDTGTVKVGTQLTLDIDAQTKHYSFTLAHEFGDDGMQAKRVSIDTVTYKGAPTTVERTETDVNLAFPSAVTIDDPKMLFGSILLIEGTFDPAAGKITGERTIPAHSMDNQTPAPGELVVRFTLTPQPE